MEILVLLERVAGKGYRAESLTLSGFTAEAPTREEALDQLRELVRGKLSRGEVVRLQVPLPGEPHPWLAIAGTWKDDPDLPEFEQNIREYRRQIDLDPDRP
jgi:hypothetical protein